MHGPSTLFTYVVFVFLFVGGSSIIEARSLNGVEFHATNDGIAKYEPIKNLTDPYVQGVAKFAVEEHNKEEKSHLELVNVVNGESQVVAGTNYKLTIAANDSHQYEAVVYDKPWQHYRSLTSFTQV